MRACGGGRPHKAALVRKELYEWWASMRYAIDWKALAKDRRSRGKKLLARIPRAILRNKANQLFQGHACTALLNGTKVQTAIPDAHWFRRWESDYGLSMRKANRKYQVPRPVLKERLEIFWVNLLRIRFLIFKLF